MSRIPGVRRAFRLPWRRARAEVEEEFAFHLDMRARELVAQGWAPEAARLEALRQFGDLDDARTYCRLLDEWRERRTMRMEFLEELRRDAGFALRTLGKARGFTTVAVLTLALGVGANTAIFSVVRGILLRPLPFTNPERLVMVASTYDDDTTTTSPANFVDWKAQTTSFTSMAALEGGGSAILTGAGDPERLLGYDASPDFFSILGVPALVGRSAFTAEEGQFEGPRVVVLRESLWRTRFGSDPRLVGSGITLDNEPHTVVGIVSDSSAWPSKAMFWRPLRFDPAELPHSRGAIYLTVVARLRPGVSFERAATEMRTVARRLEAEYPKDNTGASSVVVKMHEWIVGDLRTPLLVLLGAVGFVLLIACANVANLFLVRAVARETEIALRTALGAGRGRLVRQLVTESVVLSLIGGAVGLLLAVWGTHALVALAPTDIPRLGGVRVDGVVLAVTLLVSLAAGVAFGLIPARQALRPDLSRTLKEGGRGSRARPGSHRARTTLVVSEVALAVMLLAGAGLLIRSFRQLVDVDPGFRTDHAVSFAVSLPEAKYKTLDRQRAFMSELTERVRALPGVQSVGAALGMPLTQFGFRFSFKVEGRPPLPPGQEPAAEVRIATPSYFPAMGIRVVRGRGFTAEDRDGAQRVLLVTEEAARQFFPNEDPIGKRVEMGWSRDSVPLGGEIVGVVGDVKQSSLAKAALPQFYAPFDQWPVEAFTLVLRTARDPHAVIAGARAALHEVDPDLAMYSVKTLDEVVAESVARPRFYMMLLGGFAGVALVLSAVGIYGVIAFLVSQRTHEIGIRIALGASREQVVRMVVREGAAMAAAGIAVGLVGALALTRLMHGLLFGVSPNDPLTFLGVAAVLGAVALSAAWVPARRASHVDPALAMRAE